MISQRLLFKKKKSIMAKGKMPKNRGGIFNIAVDVHDICNSLSWNSWSSGIILAKLLASAFNGHTYFEPLCT